ncbi:hypothetical protein [Shewanella algicola]|uniref:hypothetical protein n=1 Tax=Shewanella algicola TaxID=640633 RepID=UPI0024953298|nr:hypothetical protein [Shewanella algicola]
MKLSYIDKAHQVANEVARKFGFDDYKHLNQSNDETLKQLARNAFDESLYDFNGECCASGVKK